MRFRAEQHLRRQRDFRDMRELGRRFDCGGFVLWYRRRPPIEGSVPSDQPDQADGRLAAPSLPRVGVVASSASVGGAVQRNRVKRHLREVFRCHQDLVPIGYDLLLIARTSIRRQDFAEIEKRFVEACRRLFPTPS